ncbi:MAG: hypothetical protein FWG50_12300 [Kiritimatiellaeota bacterium]|nr:hypothetical protein [Kiritimatiellota bacterium]
MSHKCVYTVICLLLAGCAKTDVARTISSDHCIIISSSGKEWRLEPVFVNRGRSAYVLLEVEKGWETEPPWENVVKDGKKIRVWAQLEDKNGKIYHSAIVGSQHGVDGHKIDLRFSNDLPRCTEFKKIRLFSSQDFPVKNISLRSRNFL